MRLDALDAIIAIQHQVENFAWLEEVEEVREETDDLGGQQDGCRPLAGEAVKWALERGFWRYGMLEDVDPGESSEDEEIYGRETDERSRLRQRSICRSHRERVWWVDQA